MALSKTVIISNAISLLGHAPIITLDQPDDLTVSAEQAYDLLLPGALSANPWRFAVQIQQLSKSIEVPPTNTGWQSIYLLPADFLKTIRMHPQSYQYEFFESKKIYTNFSGDVAMEYVFEPDVSLLPPHFTNYFVYEIAAYLALSNAQRPDYYRALEQRRITALATAAAIDAQNRPQSPLASSPVLNNRHLGGLISNFD